MSTTMPVGRRERLAHWWELRGRRERGALLVAAAAAAALLLWTSAWQPLQRDTERLARQLAEERAALATARRSADEIARLAQTAPTPASGDARTAIEGALARFALKPVTGVERVDAERWRVSFDAIAFDSLPALVDTLQRDASLRAVEVSVTARVEPGQVRAEATFVRN
jgi:type II secretory pathway component PulM